MKTIEIKETKSVAPRSRVERCGGLMRLVGSEPHPGEAKIDLLTFNCTACDEFQVSRCRDPDAGRLRLARYNRKAKAPDLRPGASDMP